MTGSCPPVCRRVLVARSDNAGDVLLAGPAVRAVAAGAQVVLLCGPAGEAAGRLLPGVASVVAARLPGIDPDPLPVDPAAVDALVAHLATLEVDEAVVLTSFHQSPLPLALLLRMAGVPRVAAICADHPGSLLDVRHAVDDDVHEVERGLSLAAAAGHHLPPADDGRLAVVLPGPDAPARRALAFVTERPTVVVHPGASVPARTWAPERFADAAAAVSGAGWRVVVTGSRVERPLTAAVVAGARCIGAAPSAVTDLGGALDLAGLAHVLAAAEALVVGNTGPAHLAAAVGTPVVSIYPPTVPASRWRPWAVPHALLGDQQVPCCGCRSRRCPWPEHPCVAGVSAADVVAAVAELAGAPARRRRPVAATGAGSRAAS